MKIMSGTRILQDYRQIPTDLRNAIEGISDDELKQMPGAAGLSMWETVHHLTEANIVAASMILAALGASGATYDWSWLYPNRDWCNRLGYPTAPIAPALATLDGLIEHIANLIDSSGDGLEREVTLFDMPGAETYTKTVGEIIRQEVEHVGQHIEEGRNASIPDK